MSVHYKLIIYSMLVVVGCILQKAGVLRCALKGMLYSIKMIAL